MGGVSNRMDQTPKESMPGFGVAEFRRRITMSVYPAPNRPPAGFAWFADSEGDGEMTDYIASGAVFGEPDTPLKNIVGFAGFTESVGRKVERLEPCRPRAAIIISLDSEICLGSAGDARNAYHGFVTGPGCPPIVSSHGGRLSCIEIDVAPWASPALFGTALDIDAPVSLATIFGAAGDALSAQLATAPDWPSRFAHIEHFVGKRLDDARRGINSEIRWAWDQLRRSGGRTPIAALADEIGWSGRYFGVRFREETGIGPKAAARRLRFDRARRIVQEPPLPLADAALAGGYSDQSHMTREFAELAGCAPAALRTARFPDLLGTPASAARR